MKKVITFNSNTPSSALDKYMVGEGIREALLGYIALFNDLSMNNAYCSESLQFFRDLRNQMKTLPGRVVFSPQNVVKKMGRLPSVINCTLYIEDEDKLVGMKLLIFEGRRIIEIGNTK